MTKEIDNVIYAYTRAEAIEDGEQIDVSETAREAGIRFPVFLTRTVFDGYVAVPINVFGQDEAGRLWDILWMCRDAMARARAGASRIDFCVYVRNDNRAPRRRQLTAVCGPLDIDNPHPSITVMMPDEE